MTISQALYTLGTGAVGFGAGAVVGTIVSVGGAGAGAYCEGLFNIKSYKGSYAGALAASSALTYAIEGSSPFFWAMRSIVSVPSLMCASHFTNQTLHATPKQKQGNIGWYQRGFYSGLSTTVLLSTCAVNPLASLAAGWVVATGAVKWGEKIDKIQALFSSKCCKRSAT